MTSSQKHVRTSTAYVLTAPITLIEMTTNGLTPLAAYTPLLAGVTGAGLLAFWPMIGQSR